LLGLAGPIPANHQESSGVVIPMQRFAMPGQIAAAIAFFASDDASFTLGS